MTVDGTAAGRRSTTGRWSRRCPSSTGCWRELTRPGRTSRCRGSGPVAAAAGDRAAERPSCQRLLEALDLRGWPTARSTRPRSASSSAPRWPGRWCWRPGWPVLDEPTGHQDDDHVEQVLAAVRAVAAAGTRGAVASHDDRVLEAADRVVRLDRGRLLA